LLLGTKAGRFLLLLILRHYTSPEIDILSQIAIHWGKAEIHEKAIVYYAKAAELAMNDFSHELACSFLDKAIALYNLLSLKFPTPSISNSQNNNNEAFISRDG